MNKKKTGITGFVMLFYFLFFFYFIFYVLSPSKWIRCGLYAPIAPEVVCLLVAVVAVAVVVAVWFCKTESDFCFEI